MICKQIRQDEQTHHSAPYNQTGYNAYTSQNNAKLSSLALNNIEALADTRESGSECVGCVYTRLQICRTLGDWGACLGEYRSYI